MTIIKRNNSFSFPGSYVILNETSVCGAKADEMVFRNERLNGRLACYYSKVPEIASGNRMIVEKGIGEALESEENVRAFLRDIKEGKQENYRQMELAFV